MEIYTPRVEGTHLNLLVYGPPGVGKTTFAASAAKHPELSPVLFLNIEGGLLSTVGTEGVIATDVDSIEDLEKIFWELKQSIDRGEPIARTVVIDSGTEAQTISLEEAAVKAMKKRPREDRDDREIADYGRSTGQMSRIFRWFRDLPMHTIITALPYETTTPKTTTVIECAPSFTLKLRKSVMGYVDFVWYLGFSSSGERVLLTRPKGVYVAKTRGHEFSQKLGEQVKGDALDLAHIFDLLKSTEKTKS